MLRRYAKPELPLQQRRHAIHLFQIVAVARYLARACPRCGDYLGVVIPESDDWPNLQVLASCAVCGFELCWEIIMGGKADAPKNFAR
jgi:hypothetical protein